MFLGSLISSDRQILGESVSLTVRNANFRCWRKSFIFLIHHQICVVLISASLLHRISQCCFFRKKSSLLVSLFPSVRVVLQMFVSWLTSLVQMFFTFCGGGRIEEIRWS